MLDGIDVSQHNGKIDWERVKASGIGFAIIRIGFGSDMKSQDDKMVLTNIKECERLGIPYGLYLYSYAITEEEAHSEAQHMLRIVNGQHPELGCWYDMEDADGYKEKHNFAPLQHKEELTQFCKIFLKDMRKSGYDNVGIYASRDYFKNILDTDALRKEGKIWLAHWGITSPSMECEVWQYTDNGKVSGISGKVDMDYYYGAVEKNTAEMLYYPAYSGKLPLAAALNSMGIDSSREFRKKIAHANGIYNYTGTYAQNIEMLSLLKRGMLIKV